MVGDTVLRGEAPYRHAWDFKPPAIFFAFALAELLFGSDAQAVRLLESLGLLSVFAAFAVLSWRHTGTSGAGILSARVAILAYVPLEYWNTAQPEGLGGIAVAWALVCATCVAPPHSGRSGELREFLAWGCAAALYSVAALFKPPLGGALGSASRSYSWRARGRPGPGGRRLGMPTLAFLLGSALPLVATVAFFAKRGALAELYDAFFTFAPHYTAVNLRPNQIPHLLRAVARQWLFQLAPYNLVGLVCLLLLPRLHERERLGVAHVLSVVAISLVGVSLQAKLFGYHYAAAVLLTGRPAGWGYWKLWVRMRVSVLYWVAPIVLLYLVWSGLLVPGGWCFGRSEQP